MWFVVAPSNGEKNGKDAGIRLYIVLSNAKNKKRLNMKNNKLPELDWISLRQWEYYTIQIDWLLSNKIHEVDKQDLIKIYNEYTHNNKVIPIQLQEYIT